MIPLTEACVATGIKIGRETGPWGRLRTEARAFVVYKPDRCIISTDTAERKRPIEELTLTEHLATTSKESAVARDDFGVCSMTKRITICSLLQSILIREQRLSLYLKVAHEGPLRI